MVKRLAFSSIFILAILVAPAFSQTNDEGLAFLQFKFLNPGARSLAMGGAFVGLADDATAALANPAGLRIFSRMEVSVEFAANRYSNDIPYFSGNGTYVAGQNGRSNFNYDLASHPFPSHTQNLSFASFVYPWTSKNFVFSGFYSEQANFERNISTQLIPRSSGPDSVDNVKPTRSTLDISLRNYGSSFSYGLGPKVSFGASFSYSRLAMDSVSQRLNECDPNDVTCDPTLVTNQQLLNGEDGGFAFTVGTLIVPNNTFSFGAVYSRRPEFSTQSSLIVGSTERFRADRRFKVPDNFSAGVSFKPHKFVRLNFDISRVLYGQLMDGYYNAFELTNQGGGAATDFQSTTLEVDDGTEYHVGFERTIPLSSRKLLALRGGYWREPFHSVVETLPDAEIIELRNPSITNDTRSEPFFSRQIIRDFNHISVGAGLIFSKVTIDWAFDYSKDNTKRFVISTFFRVQ